MSQVTESIQHLAKSDNPIVLQTLGNRQSQDIVKAVQSAQLNIFEKIKKYRDYIHTIQDLMALSYPGYYEGSFVQKDAPVLTTTTGVWSEVFGPFAWEWINLEANAFGVLEKVPWTRSGWRVISVAGKTSGGGVAENAALPATTKPTFLTVSAKPKTIATTFDVSALQQELGLAGGDDTLEDSIAFLRDYTAREHINLVNRHLLTDVTTLPSNNLESIDRVISSNSEVTNCADVNAGDSDIYALDRDSATEQDAYVNHNSNTDRDLTLALLDSLYEQTYKFGSPSDRRVIVTGYDSLERIQQLTASRLRYVEGQTPKVQTSVNGVEQIRPGVEGGFDVTFYKGVPIIPSDNVVKDTISRIYLINLEYMKIKTLLPTQYYQSGLTTDGNPFGINRIGDEGLFVTMAELIATRFNCHAKIRDLQ